MVVQSIKILFPFRRDQAAPGKPTAQVIFKLKDQCVVLVGRQDRSRSNDWIKIDLTNGTTFFLWRECPDKKFFTSGLSTLDG